MDKLKRMQGYEASTLIYDWYYADEVDAYIAEHLPKDCVWTRCGSASTEEWANTGCGLKEIDINKLNDEAPLNYCQNCGGKITQPPQEEGQ